MREHSSAGSGEGAQEVSPKECATPCDTPEPRATAVMRDTPKLRDTEAPRDTPKPRDTEAPREMATHFLSPSDLPTRELAALNWERVRALDPSRVVAVLPIGATEAHGPHLPLGTDDIIAEAMARAGAARLAARGYEPLILPTLSYTAAPFAAAFPGTISVSPATVTALVTDIARGLAAHGIRVLALANAHLDPAHLGALHAAVAAMARAATAGAEIAEPATLTEHSAAMVGAGGAAGATGAEGDVGAPPIVVFPDITRRPWASRLTAEFRSGACHAGQYETSIILAERPALVDDEVRATLPSLPHSLVAAIRDGRRTFAEAGGPRAYFGDPAAASAEEGRRTVEVLGEILEEAVLEAIAGEMSTATSTHRLS